jgi:DNA modification methylase
MPIPSAAVVISDPPYNIGKPQLIQQFKDKKTGKRETIGQDFGADFDTAAPLPKEWVPHLPDTAAVFYGAKRMETLLRTFRKAGYEVVQDFHWCKSNSPMPMRGVGFVWGVESGYLFRRVGTKHRVNKKAGYVANYFVHPLMNGKERQRHDHTTQKPVSVMKWLVHSLTTPNALVADPFMGSGSTGVAAVALGRSFMGCERQEKYFNIAVRRIAAALTIRGGRFGYTD